MVTVKVKNWGHESQAGGWMYSCKRKSSSVSAHCTLYTMGKFLLVLSDTPRLEIIPFIFWKDFEISLWCHSKSRTAQSSTHSPWPKYNITHVCTTHRLCDSGLLGCNSHPVRWTCCTGAFHILYNNASKHWLLSILYYIIKKTKCCW